MSNTAAAPRGLSDRRILFRCACLAIIAELLLIEAAGWRGHWLAHPQKTKGLDPDTFIETQMVQLPETPQLTSEHPHPEASKAEAVISKEVGQGRKGTAEEHKALESPTSNVTQQAPPATAAELAPTHGPVAVFRPAPVIPSYLTEQNLKTAVVIEFLISSLGVTTVKLIGSSDNEELDAIAVATAKTWQFKPAEKDHKPIDSKVRLRIVFEVH